MALHDTDRRRLLLAAVVTLIAVPAFLLYDRSDGDTATDTSTGSAATVETDSAAATPTSNQSQLPAQEAPDDAPIFMNGRVADPDDDVARVAVPAEPDVVPLQLTATYRRSVPGAQSCLIASIPTGQTITVTNLDNGRSITCVTAAAPATQGDEIVLHTSSFEQLADLTEAPIHVEVRQ